MKKRILRSVSVLIIAFILTLALYIQQTNKYKDWVSTQGVLYNFEEVHSRYRKSSSTSYRLYYTYEVDGIEYTGADSYPGNLPDHYYIGEKVNVMYDKNKPSDSLHERPRTELITRLPIIWSVPIALIMLLPKKKRKKQQQDFWTEMGKRGMSKEEATNILNKWEHK